MTAGWFVAHTQPHAESRALHHLGNQDFTAYLPRYRKQRRHARRVETVLAPLFPRYVFVQLDLERQQWRSINGTVGVSHLVMRGDRPAPVPEGVIEEIRRREDSDGAIAIAPSLRKGDTVRIVDGPLADLEALFEEMADEHRVVLLLDLLGRPHRVRVALSSLEAG